MRRALGACLASTAGLLVPSQAHGHVKWFTQYDPQSPPARLAAILTPTLLALAVASVVAVGLVAVIERRLKRTDAYQRVDRWLAQRSEQALLVLRIAVGATLLLSWQADSLLAPELEARSWLGWAQFGLAALLLFRRTVPLAGVGLGALYLVAMARYGWFHMLDYLHYAGIAWYLMVAQARSEPLRESRIPALYLAVGFSLCWLALEKIVYPQWAGILLAQNPQLTLGFDPDFFRVAAAFVEFTLGYLFIICLFERPTAALVTVVFFSTTLVFGKVEVIGHTAIHGALIVFLLEGPGRFYRPPIDIHRRLGLRTLFASVNYALLFALGLFVYQRAAWHRHQQTASAGRDAVRPSVVISAAR